MTSDLVLLILKVSFCLLIESAIKASSFELPCHYDLDPNGYPVQGHLDDNCTMFSFTAIGEHNSRVSLRFYDFYVGRNAACFAFDHTEVGAEPSAVFKGRYPGGRTDAVASTHNKLFGVCRRLKLDLDFLFHVQVDTVSPVCDEITLTARNKEKQISSPGFGSLGYSSNLVCEWYIVAQPPAGVKLRFASIKTQSNWDVITVFDGSDRSGDRRLFASGRSRRGRLPLIISRGHELYVKFTSDREINDEGFLAFYSEYSYPSSAECSLTNIIVRVGTDELRELNYKDDDDVLVVSRLRQTTWHSVPQACRATKTTPTLVEFEFHPPQCDVEVRWNYKRHTTELAFRVRKLGGKTHDVIVLTCLVQHPKIQLDLPDQSLPLDVAMASSPEGNFHPYFQRNSVVAGDYIYIQAKTPTVYDQLQLTAQTCHVIQGGTTSNPRSLPIIMDGCPVNQLFGTQMFVDCGSNVVEMRFRSFAWSDERVESSTKPIRIQCDFILCLQDGDSCSPDCSARFRRDVEFPQSSDLQTPKPRVLDRSTFATTNCSWNGTECEQTCESMDEVVRCACYDGYILRTDRISCIKAVSSDLVYVAHKYYLVLISIFFALTITFFLFFVFVFATRRSNFTRLQLL